MKYRLTTQRQVRHEFWQSFPKLPRRKIRDYSGTGKMHCTDVRCAFANFIDLLSCDGSISPEMVQRVTL